MRARHCVALLLCAVPAATLGQDAPSGEAERLVRQLGDPVWARRVGASRTLLALGDQALPALRQAASAGLGLEAATRANELRWRILLPESMFADRSLRRHQVIAWFQKKGDLPRGALSLLLDQFHPGLALAEMIEELLEGPHWDLALARLGDLQAPEPVCRALVAKLWPFLEERAEKLTLADLRVDRPLAPRRPRVRLGVPPLPPLRLPSQVVWQLADRKDDWCWPVVLALSRIPGPHHRALAKRLQLLEQRSPGRDLVLRLGVKREVERRIAEGDWSGEAQGDSQPLLVTLLWELRSHRQPPGWNAWIMRLIGAAGEGCKARAELIRVLNSGEPIPGGEHLLRHLEDPDLAAAAAVLQILGSARSRLQDRISLGQLSRLARRGNRELCKQAIWVLGERQGAGARRALLAFLADDDPFVAAEAGIALGNRAGGVAGKALARRLAAMNERTPPGQVAAVIEALGRLAYREAAPLIRRHLASPSEEVVRAALAELACTGEAADEDQLAGILSKGDRETIQAGFRLVDTQATPRLARLLLDLDLNWETRERELVEKHLRSRSLPEVAERVLSGKLRGEEAWLRRLFTQHWRKEAAGVRPLLVRGRDAPEHRELVEELMAVMDDSRRLALVTAWLADRSRRDKAFRVLMDNPDERALEPLLRALDPAWPDAGQWRYLVEKVVWGRSPDFRQPRGFTVADEIEWWKRWHRAQRSGSRRVDWIGSFLRGGGPYDRIAAIAAAGELGYRELLPLVLARLDSAVHAERRAAIDALGLCGDPRAVEPLKRIETDRDERVALAASEALARLGDRHAAGRLGNWIVARWLARNEIPFPDGTDAVRRARLLASLGYRTGFQALLAWRDGINGVGLLSEEALAETAGLVLPGETGFQPEPIRAARVAAWWARHAAGLKDLPPVPRTGR